MTSEIPDDPRQQDSQTTSPEDKAAKESKDGTTGLPPLPQSEPTPHAGDEPYHCRYYPSQRWKDWLEGIALLAGIGYAIVTFCMWRDNRHYYEVNERAWITVTDAIVYEDLTYPKSLNKPVFKIRYTLKNVGHSVAFVTVG